MYDLPNQQDPDRRTIYSHGLRITSKDVRDLTNSDFKPAARAYKAIVTPPGSAGDFTDIQTAINYVSSLGGGNVLIRSGTYVLTTNLTIPENIYLIGEDFVNTIIKLNAVNVQIVATPATPIDYNTGTITLTNASNIVTGSGTSWLTNVVAGEYLEIRGALFLIQSVDTDTQFSTFVLEQFCTCIPNLTALVKYEFLTSALTHFTSCSPYWGFSDANPSIIIESI